MNRINSGIIITIIAVLLPGEIINAQTKEIDKAKAEISELLKKDIHVLKTKDRDDKDYDKTVRYDWGNEKNIFVSDDKIEFKSKKESTSFLFSDLKNYEIHFTTSKDGSGITIDDFLILFKGEVDGKILIDDLYLIQNQMTAEIMKNKYAPQLTLFEPLAADYRSLKIKPQISEEQRKYIVQANSFNEQKNYQRAIELFKKAIEVDQTSYPAAYLNLALLSAQTKEYYQAIFYMKKYLLLVPDAEDARAAQDKIYVWEGIIGE